MSTTNQLVKNPRRKPKRKSEAPALLGAPQRSGSVIKVSVIKPKKPNSANRVVVTVRLTTGQVVRAYVPGERNNLTEHSHVLIRGGRVPDLPGIRYKVVRGALDCAPGEGPTTCTPANQPKVYRRKGRSKYGVKRGTVTKR
jgi:small subunit ribosomal protein S12